MWGMWEGWGCGQTPSRWGSEREEVTGVPFALVELIPLNKIKTRFRGFIVCHREALELAVPIRNQ